MTHLKPRSATVTLYQGDDMDRLAELQRKVELAQRIAQNGAGNARMDDAPEDGDPTPLKDAQAAFDAFVDEAAARALSIEIRTIGRRRFRDLVAEHPPRMVEKKAAPPAEGEAAAEPKAPEMVEHDEDAGWGINTETFPLALLCFRDEGTVTIAQPDFATKADVQRFVDDELNEGDFDQLWQASYLLNRTPSQDPKGLVYSLSASLSTDET